MGWGTGLEPGGGSRGASFGGLGRRAILRSFALPANRENGFRIFSHSSFNQHFRPRLPKGLRSDLGTRAVAAIQEFGDRGKNLRWRKGFGDHYAIRHPQ